MPAWWRWAPTVQRHKVGDRALVQTDYRHMLTASSNASFGYNFEGALQQYVLMDERVIIDPETGERFLIPVSEEPSASAVGLLEPWACVERAYATDERGTLKAGGRLLVVTDPGRPIDGVDALMSAVAPAPLTAVTDDEMQHVTLDMLAAAADVEVAHVDDLGSLEPGTFDDIIYFGSNAERVEQLQSLLGQGGVIDIVLGGELLGRPVEIDVGRVHYDLTRWVGTTGTSAAEGYAWVPASGELRAGEQVGIIGAAGPMGFMHVVRALTAGVEGVSVTAIDIDEARLAHLASVAAPHRTGERARLRVARQPGDAADGRLHPRRLHGARAGDRGGHRGAGRRGRHHRLLRRLRHRHDRAARPRRDAAQARLHPGHQRLHDQRHEGRAGPPRRRHAGHQHQRLRRQSACRAWPMPWRPCKARTSGGKIVIYPQLTSWG